MMMMLMMMTGVPKPSGAVGAIAHNVAPSLPEICVDSIVASGINLRYCPRFFGSVL